MEDRAYAWVKEMISVFEHVRVRASITFVSGTKTVYKVSQTRHKGHHHEKFHGGRATFSAVVFFG